MSLGDLVPRVGDLLDLACVIVFRAKLDEFDRNRHSARVRVGWWAIAAAPVRHVGRALPRIRVSGELVDAEKQPLDALLEAVHGGGASFEPEGNDNAGNTDCRSDYCRE